ncbi:hypothetical protein [uncultured Rubinisphaera sp.]|uniref:dCTP deaminase domain-containing protein n=1 Tax=uncultured Rubinisphaera sp. TaxID=1678686 RepID=UPI0030DCB01E
MTFWRSETMRERIPSEQLIEPYDKDCIKHSAYEFRMGGEAFITSTTDKVKIELKDAESFVIPPGQFALLLTEERIKVPLNAIAFISMRFGVKRRGLINVSGFHVDPGFEGRLKFSVYNAGSSDITITQGDRIFMIWYADLDGTTIDGYKSAGRQLDLISSDDQNVMHGDIASPAELKSQLDELKHYDVNRKWMLGVLVATFLAILLRLLFMTNFAVPESDDIDRLRKEIVTQIRNELSINNTEQKTSPPPVHDALLPKETPTGNSPNAESGYHSSDKTNNSN